VSSIDNEFFIVQFRRNIFLMSRASAGPSYCAGFSM